MVVALGDEQDVVVEVLIDHVPGSVGVVGQAANTQALALTDGVVHQALVLAQMLAAPGSECRRVGRAGTAAGKSVNRRSPIKQIPVESFFLRGGQADILQRAPHFGFFDFTHGKKCFCSSHGPQRGENSFDPYSGPAPLTACFAWD